MTLWSPDAAHRFELCRWLLRFAPVGEAIQAKQSKAKQEGRQERKTERKKERRTRKTERRKMKIIID